MFRLSRYYSLASLIGIGVIAVALSLFFHQQAMQMLLQHQTLSNTDLARSYANAIWHHFEDFVLASEAWSAEELRQRPELQRLGEQTRSQMEGMSVAKVKIYNLTGRTVFSTEAGQIGEDKRDNAGFLSARAGSAASEIVFRDTFYSFEGLILDRNLIATYLPIRDEKNGQIKAVLELYADVTPLVKEMEAAQIKIFAGVAGALLLLYLFLFLIIRRADGILRQQGQERRENEDRIRHQAFHDSLTGLPNRDSFLERIGEAVSRAKRHNHQGALLFLDLDRFKLINDSLGHDAGDQLLRITASRILKSLRDTDMVFRMSGDEFLVIVEDLDHAGNAALTAQRILEIMATPVNLGGCEVIVNISIGITIFPNDELDVEGLVKEADTAMYRAKQAGHSHYEFYTPALTTVTSGRLALETDLQRALQNDEFLLHYQPKVDTGTKAMVGVEALLRWRQPKKGIVPPNDFIYLLESMGLINAVGEWVLIQACRQVRAWIASGLQPLRMSVNISAKQFCNPSLVDTVRRALESSGLAPEYLELELTESMFIKDAARSIEMMKELKALGVSLSIDDFGSGYSSLAYLKEFPVDYLKIDRSFVRDLATNKKDVAIVRAISALAQSLDMKLVAEGVEDNEQALFLEQQGCHELQGYLFGRPMPATELEAMLRQPTIAVTK